MKQVREDRKDYQAGWAVLDHKAHAVKEDQRVNKDHGARKVCLVFIFIHFYQQSSASHVFTNICFCCVSVTLKVTTL